MKGTKCLILVLGVMAGRPWFGSSSLASEAPKPVNAENAGVAMDTRASIPRSIFEVPSSPEEGRDPFYPKSTRLFAGKKANSSTPPSATLSLSLRGLAGLPGSRLATLRTSENPPRTVILAEGEERTVSVQGAEVRIRCVQITDDRVLVEVNGVRQELQLRSGF